MRFLGNCLFLCGSPVSIDDSQIERHSYPFGISSSRQACSFPSCPRILSSCLCVDVCSGLVDEVVWSCDPGEQEAHGPLGWCRDLVILFQEYRPSSVTSEQGRDELFLPLHCFYRGCCHKGPQTAGPLEISGFTMSEAGSPAPVGVLARWLLSELHGRSSSLFLSFWCLLAFTDLQQSHFPVIT